MVYIYIYNEINNVFRFLRDESHKREWNILFHVNEGIQVKGVFSHEGIQVMRVFKS